MEVSGEGVRLGDLEITFEAFPSLVHAHLRECPDTLRCEEQGVQLRKSLERGDTSEEDVESFIRSVTRWGGKTGNRVWGVMHMNFSPIFVRDRFVDAVAILNEVDVHADQHFFTNQMWRAANVITEVHGLATSYGSKMLRFLRPDLSGVFDRVIGAQTGCDVSNRNYEIYSFQCVRSSEFLRARNVQNPRTSSIDWGAGEVDQAVFARCNGYG